MRTRDFGTTLTPRATILSRLSTLLAPIAVAVLAAGSSALAASPQPRTGAPGSELTYFRAVASQFRVAGADTRYTAITDLAGISCIADPGGTGAMGVHYLDGDILFDGAIDPAQPEAIVYAPAPNGSLHLVALEYLVVKAAWDSAHSSPPELIAGHPFETTAAGNRFGLPAYYSQHIWVGRGNPLGNLAVWDPAVHCH